MQEKKYLDNIGLCYYDEKLKSYISEKYYNKGQVNNLIANIDKLTYEKVNSVSEVTEPNIIYLVPKEDPGTSNNFYEYMYIDESPELIGETDIDLSNYVTKDEFIFATNNDIDAIFNPPAPEELEEIGV